MGRPQFKITDGVCKKAEALAAQGLTVVQIAQCLDMGERTLYEKQAEFPRFAHAIESGRAKGVQVVTNALMKRCQQGDTGAIKYYLNNRGSNQWADRKEVSVDGNITSHEDRLEHLR